MKVFIKYGNIWKIFALYEQHLKLSMERKVSTRARILASRNVFKNVSKNVQNVCIKESDNTFVRTHKCTKNALKIARVKRA